MRFAWFPKPYKLVWLVFFLSMGAWALQARDPERFNMNVFYNLGMKLTVTAFFFIIIGLIWIMGNTWEQKITHKENSPRVTVSPVDRLYGSIQFDRKVPRRVWEAAEVGDSLFKPRWSLFVEFRKKRG